LVPAARTCLAAFAPLVGFAGFAFARFAFFFVTLCFFDFVAMGQKL
jgi:hypothetical protein